MRSTLIAAVLLLSGSPLAMAQQAFTSSSALLPSATSPAIPNAIQPTAAPPIGTSPATGSDAVDTSVAVGPPRSILTPPDFLRKDRLASSAPAVPAVSSLNRADVRARLEAMGYTNIASLKPKASGGWAVVATRDGSQASIDLDSSGNIEPR